MLFYYQKETCTSFHCTFLKRISADKTLDWIVSQWLLQHGNKQQHLFLQTPNITAFKLFTTKIISNSEVDWRLVEEPGPGNGQPVPPGLPQGSIPWPRNSTTSLMSCTKAQSSPSASLHKGRIMRSASYSRCLCCNLEGLNRLGNWAEKDLLKFNRRKCSVLHLERNNLMHHHKPGMHSHGKEGQQHPRLH